VSQDGHCHQQRDGQHDEKSSSVTNSKEKQHIDELWRTLIVGLPFSSIFACQNDTKENHLQLKNGS